MCYRIPQARIIDWQVRLSLSHWKGKKCWLEKKLKVKCNIIHITYMASFKSFSVKALGRPITLSVVPTCRDPKSELSSSVWCNFSFMISTCVYLCCMSSLAITYTHAMHTSYSWNSDHWEWIYRNMLFKVQMRPMMQVNECKQERYIISLR